MPNSTLSHDLILSLLELLAEEAPPARIEEVLQRSRQNGDPDSLGYVGHIGDLALRVRTLMSDQRQREADLTALVDAARDLAAASELASLLNVLTKKARTLLGMGITYVSLREDGDMSFVRASDGETTAANVGRKTSDLRGIAGLIHRKRTAVWSPDYLEDERFEHEEDIDAFVRAEGLRAVMGVPLKRADVVFGVLFGADRRVRHFTPDEVSMMVSLADLAVGLIERTSQLAYAHADAQDVRHERSRSQTALAAVHHMLDVHNRAVGLVLDGCDLPALMTTVAYALDAAVVLRDSGGRPLACSGEVPTLESSAVEAIAMEAHVRGEPVQHADNTWTVPLLAADEHLGALTVWPELPLADEDTALLQLVAQTVTVALLLQRRPLNGSSRGDLLGDLLSGPAPTHQSAERARRSGVDPGASHIVVLAHPEGAELGRTAAWASSYLSRAAGLRTVQDGCVVMLLPGSDASAAARQVSALLTPLLEHPVSVASSGPERGLARVRELHQEATRTLEAMTLLHGPGATASAADLGFLGLLLSQDRDVEGFVRTTIGPILEYDAESQGELVKTLREYFKSANNQRLAAELLHVHPNTVARRLERITQLLGTDWQRPDRLLQTQLALLLHHTHIGLVRAADPNE
ncbi:helix-turn-helix domain-containing protein [Streptomyces albidoflavus]